MHQLLVRRQWGVVKGGAAEWGRGRWLGCPTTGVEQQGCAALVVPPATVAWLTRPFVPAPSDWFAPRRPSGSHLADHETDDHMPPPAGLPSRLPPTLCLSCTTFARPLLPRRSLLAAHQPRHHKLAERASGAQPHDAPAVCSRPRLRAGPAGVQEEPVPLSYHTLHVSRGGQCCL